jgi:hypothetical protein
MSEQLTPEQIAENVVSNYLAGGENNEPLERIELLTICRNAAEQARAVPDFKPEGEHDYYRDAYFGSMTTHGYAYLSIPSTPPIHLGDDQARRILAMLSTEAGQ